MTQKHLSVGLMTEWIFTYRGNKMGWKSTVDVTRQYALDKIMDELYEANDEQIADILETLIGDRDGANYRIVNEENGKI